MAGSCGSSWATISASCDLTTVGYTRFISTCTIILPRPPHRASDKTRRILIDSVEHALSLGACGVAMNCFIGSAYEPELLEHLGQVAEHCDRWGMPLIAMINPTEQYQFDPEQLAY